MMNHDDVELMEAVAPRAPMSIDTSGLTGNGTAYARMDPAPGEALRLLSLVQATRPPFDPATLRDAAHVTIVYSRDAGIDLARLMARMPAICRHPAEATAECVDYWEGHDKDGYAVFKLYFPAADGWNAELRAAGAEHSFDEFQAHMTICGKVGPRTPEVDAWLGRINAELAATRPSIVFDRIVLEDIKP